jgi:hypothetical protein
MEDLAFERVKNPVGNRGSDLLLIAPFNAHKIETYGHQHVGTGDGAYGRLRVKSELMLRCGRSMLHT